VTIDYTLAVLTSGNHRTLRQSLASFLDKVRPAPERVIVYSDGGNERALWTAISLLAEPQSMDYGVEIASRQRGFCEATGRLWHAVAHDTATLAPFVFWLEHDFTFMRPVDLDELARPLIEEPGVCQMQLMRTPVSQEEIAAGGLYQLRWEDYEPRVWLPEEDPVEPDVVVQYPLGRGKPWQHHRAYFTTNPSLMQAEFMRANPWPIESASCEGLFGIDLIRRGFSFGVGGDGEPWVQHIGRREGFGY
jgi:hypothetical protein